MPALQSTSMQTVSQGSPTAVPWLVYVLAFLAAGGIAYWRGEAIPQPLPEVGSAQSTAVVRLQEPGADDSAPADGSPPVARSKSTESAIRAARPAPDDIRQKILAQAGQHSAESLQIETASGSAPGEIRVSLTLAGKTAAESVAAVNALAQSYAETYCRQWKASVERAYCEAHEAADQAQRQFHEATSRLDAFLDRQQQTAREAARRIVPSGPAMVDNPNWVQQDHQLGELRRRRADLLKDRTPLHPAVQDVDRRIEEVGQQLASMPRQIPAEPKAVGPMPPAVGPSPAAPPNLAELQQLQQAVGQASRASEETIRLEQQAWHVRLLEPKIDLELASSPSGPSRFHSRFSTLLAALAAGTSIVTGLAMISTGAAIQPSLATVAELQAVLPVPIVGIIPETDPNCPSAGRRSRQRLFRVVLMVAGLLVMAGCVAMLAVSVVRG